MKWEPWGKLDRSAEGAPRIHPLLDHMTDVACVFHALLRVQGVRRAAETAAGRVLSPIDIARLCVLCFLHDIGKANAGFQVRYWSERSEVPPVWYAPPCGHGPQGWAVLIGKFHDALRVRAGLPLDELISWGDACETLLHASISHHGRPVIPDDNERVWEPVRDRGDVIHDPADTVVCRRRLNFDPPCRLNFDPGTEAGIVDAGCGQL